MSNQEYIKIEGAYENNLKHISLDIDCYGILQTIQTNG